jgi:hypothetical protein
VRGVGTIEGPARELDLIRVRLELSTAPLENECRIR